MNIIVTGASRGLGYETVLRLSGPGEHRVLALARSGEKLSRLQQACRSLNPQAAISVLEFDVLSEEHQGLGGLIEQEFGGTVHILVNNAGQMINKPFENLDDADFEAAWRSNFLGPVRMIRRLLSYLPEGGHILNIGSMGGFQGSAKFPGLAAYSASKAALHNLTECLAEELKSRDIRINCLALGSAQTEMLAQAFPGYQSPVSATEMGAFIADFALSGHRFFNGKVLPVAVTTP
ncbi:short-subunit dehydrogenase [Anseongella ginsenosidimutans]|uniref:Short-subunit dehydrogenase n=1 Tax=Anseongella ginsenosidimutans TaxID=496056 RepID=A0A4R3KX88_9SPHI|nr:SDR family oxidoreductase [Anseongella ginsenosidimutans]QEC51049.1 SDR family oxidoreductase [Anseongella ginsenosidimutans]TCS90295.1 short-subunit dehydrogenase [Anseongella ginsenosidimutans]